MNHQKIEYALAKQVPDMARGFVVHTNYGDITIPPGRMADRIKAQLECALQRELANIGLQIGRDFAKRQALIQGVSHGH